MNAGSVPLIEQERLKELFLFMDKNGLKEEKKQVMEMADYIDHMDERFSQVLGELKEVREQVGQIHDKGIRATALRAVERVEQKVNEVKIQFVELKNAFVGHVKESVSALKNKGIQAFHKVAEWSGIQKGLSKCGEQLNHLAAMTDKEISRLEGTKEQIHSAKFHLQNAGREITGKETLKLKKYEPEKGAIFQVQKALYYTMGAVGGMKKRTDRAVQRLEKLEEKAETGSRSSVLKDLKAIQSEAGGSKEKDVKIKEVAR